MPINLQRTRRRSGRSISLKSARTNTSPRSAVPARSLSFLKKKKKKNDKRDDDSLDAGFKRGVERDVRMLTSPPPPVGDVTIRTRDTSYGDATYTTYTDDETYATGATGDNDAVVMKSKFVQGVDRLLGKHEGFQAAPEEVKTEFYESLNQVAAVNAQMESKQAEHHLRGLLLDSMCLEAKMDLMMLCAGDVPDNWDEQDDDTRSYETTGTLGTDELTQEEKNALAAVKNVTRKFNFKKNEKTEEQSRKEKQQRAAVEKAKQIQKAKQAAEEEAARKAAARKAAEQKAAEQKAKTAKQAKLSIQPNKKKDTAKKGKSMVSSKSAKSVASPKLSSLKSVQEEDSFHSEYTDEESSYYSYYSDEESLYSRTYDSRLSESSPVTGRTGRSKKSDRKKKREDEPGMITKGIDWIEKIAYEDLIKTYECTPAKLCKLAEEDPKAKKEKQRRQEAEKMKKKKKKKKKTTPNHDPLLSTLRSNMNNPDPGEGDRYQSVGREVYDIATLKTTSSHLKANMAPEPLVTTSRPVNSQLKMARVAKEPNRYSILKRHHTAESVMSASQKSKQNRASFVPNMFHSRKQEFQQATPMVAYAPPYVPYAPQNVPLARSALSMPAVPPSPPVVTASVPLKGGALGTVIQTPYGRVPEPIQTDYGRRFAPQQPPPTPTTDLSKLREEMPNIPKASKAVQRANKMSGYSTPEIEKKSRYAPALEQVDSLVDRYDVDDIFEGLH